MAKRTDHARSSAGSNPVRVRFDRFELDEANARLLRDGTAVALNDDVVPRARHAATALRDGDRLEIIVAVAGG